MVSQSRTYFAELTPSISALTAYLWSRDGETSLSEWIKDMTVGFKSESGALFIKLVNKETKQVALQQDFEDKGMRIKPKQTQVFMFDSNTIALRFALNSTFLNASALPEPFVNFSIVYDGPKQLAGLTCLNCQAQLLAGQDFRVKSAPSDHWREAAGLWQCHNECFDKLLDLDCMQFDVPLNTLLHRFNSVLIPSGAQVHTDAVSVIDGLDDLRCSGCSHSVGYVSSGQAAIFDDCVSELQGLWSDNRIIETLKNHGIEDRTKDILFLQLQPTIAACKVKVLS